MPVFGLGISRQGANSFRVPVGQVICTQPATYSFWGTKSLTGVMTVNRLRVQAIWVPEPVTLDRIGCEVTGAGDVGSVLRLGIYASTGTLFPGALVLDAGTVVSDTLGIKEITISQALSPGQYWLALMQQNVTVTPATLRLADERVAVGGSAATNSSNASVSGFFVDIITVGLPTDFGPSVGPSGTIPRVFVRVV